MAWDLNTTILVGRLTRDPELSYTSNQIPVCRFSIANNRSRSGEKEDEVNFFEITTWNKLATLCSDLLQKGVQVVVEGRLRQNRYEDKTTGQNRSRIEIVANTVQIMGKKQESSDGSTPKNRRTSTASPSPDHAKASKAPIEFDPPNLDPLEDDGVPF